MSGFPNTYKSAPREDWEPCVVAPRVEISGDFVTLRESRTTKVLYIPSHTLRRAGLRSGVKAQLLRNGNAFRVVVANPSSPSETTGLLSFKRTGGAMFTRAAGFLLRNGFAPGAFPAKCGEGYVEFTPSKPKRAGSDARKVAAQ